MDLAEDAPEEVEERTWLGRYELVEAIAHGGMATVFLALARGAGGVGKVFALKRIHPHLSGDYRFVEMFFDEARIVSRIDHPNVCQVVEFGEEGGTYFLAMEHLLGEPLRRVLPRLRPLRHRHGPRVRFLAARIVADACEGLHAAHELRDASGQLLDVVHRDVSPQNLFITYDGAVKVLDFGIASARHRIHHTQTGTVKGKLGYMAPEQLRLQLADRRADVWSLGVVLFELLTGVHPLRRESDLDTMLAVVQGRLPSPREVAPDIPRELETIVARAMARDPADRFPTARAMGRALRTWMSRSGGTVDSSDVEEWMAWLFPSELDQKAVRVRGALDAAPRTTPRPSPPAPAPVGGSLALPNTAHARPPAAAAPPLRARKATPTGRRRDRSAVVRRPPTPRDAAPERTPWGIRTLALLLGLVVFSSLAFATLYVAQRAVSGVGEVDGPPSEPRPAGPAETRARAMERIP